MEPLTLLKVARMVGAQPPLGEDQAPPKPFPGRSSPVRVAWQLVVNVGRPSKNRYDRPPQKLIHHSYVGKPNRLRALEALAFGQKGQLVTLWSGEFDRQGLISWRLTDPQTIEGSTRQAFAHRFFAYHPQGTHSDPILTFAKPIYVKHVGGLSLYSYQKKLTTAQLDQYYEWYTKTFGKKLRRPKQVPMELSGGPEVDL